jgi:hypothetical protein
MLLLHSAGLFDALVRYMAETGSRTGVDHYLIKPGDNSLIKVIQETFRVANDVVADSAVDMYHPEMRKALAAMILERDTAIPVDNIFSHNVEHHRTAFHIPSMRELEAIAAKVASH